MLVCYLDINSKRLYMSYKKRIVFLIVQFIVTYVQIWVLWTYKCKANNVASKSEMELQKNNFS